jgi:predicted nucleic acid-binding protein
LLSHKLTSDENLKIQSLLKNYDILLIDDHLINKTIDIRKNHKLKLPDSIIVATAILNKAVLITSDQGIIKKAFDMNIKVLDPLS